jgi:hypothetical protein
MARRDSELMARLLATFGVEADEHLVALRRHLLELSAPRPEDEARALVERRAPWASATSNGSAQSARRC